MAGFGQGCLEDIDMKTNKQNLCFRGTCSVKVSCVYRHTTFHYENRDFFFSLREAWIPGFKPLESGRSGLAVWLLHVIAMWSWAWYLISPSLIYISPKLNIMIPSGSDGKESTCNAGDLGSIPGLGRPPWRKAWQPTPIFLSGKSTWTEEPGGLQSMVSQRIGHNWTAKHSTKIMIPLS